MRIRHYSSFLIAPSGDICQPLELAAKIMNLFITPLITLLDQGLNESKGAVNAEIQELELFEKIDIFLLRQVMPEDRHRNINPTALKLMIHSRNLWTASIRMTLSGQPYAVPSIVRTALEASCYASLIANDASLAQIWQDRHIDQASMKASRKAFGNAVDDVKKLLKNKDSRLSEQVSDTYQICIDGGAHPNIKGIPCTPKLAIGPNNFYQEYDETTDFYGIPSIKSRDALCLTAHVGILVGKILNLSLSSFQNLPSNLLDEIITELKSIIPNTSASSIDFPSII